MSVAEKFARVHLPAHLDAIKVEDRAVLALLIRAASFLNPIYLRQVSHYNPQFKQEIEDSHSRRLIESFAIMGGPWDRFDGDRPFYGNIEKPLGAGFYPEDITRGEFEQWVTDHPEDSDAFHAFTTVIRRRGDGLQAVPYSQAYALELEKAAAILREAAGIASNPSLRKYLELRAEALLSNDYAESDDAWIHLDSDIEVTFGPYETYEDRLFGYKATYEAFIGYRIPEETQRLEHLASCLEEMQAALPISDEMKSTRIAHSVSPFVVMDVLSTAGEARVGIQTLAYVLPNDPVVTAKSGTKKVMMRNVQEAKFDAILRPIAERFLTPGAFAKTSFKAFFRHTLLHETGHSLGPKAVRDGRDSIIHRLAETYSALEECKADMTSMFLSHWLYERGELTWADVEETYATMLAGFFRSLRFGITQAHAAANAIQINYLTEAGGITCDADGRYDICAERLPDAIASLVRKIMELEYEGDRDGAQAFLDRYAFLSPELDSRLKALDDIPIDIACRYDAEEPGFFSR